MCILYIKKFRLLRKMTQSELAFKVGVTQQYIALLEMDNVIRTRSPRLKLLLEISFALNVCLKDLIYCDCNNCEINNTCQKRDKVVLQDVIEENLNFYL